MDNPNDIEPILREASSLRKQGRYSESVDLYASLWSNQNAQFSEWDVWGYAFSLRKLGRSSEALMICREMNRIKPDFKPIGDLYGWCLYDIEISRNDEEIEANEVVFLEAASEIINLTSQGQYSPYTRTVLKVVEYLKSKSSYPDKRILEWTDKLNPEELSDKPFIHDIDGKIYEYASDREKWYSYRCKALLEAGRFRDCVDLGQKAINQFTTFHYDNDVWFRWYISKSMSALGNKEQALGELQTLLSRKNDWFVQYEIAQLLFELGRLDESITYALDAALNAGDIEYKWELFVLLSRLFKSQLDLDDAKKHLLLAFKIRQDHGWRILPELALEMYDLDIDTTFPKSTDDLYCELKQKWISFKRKDQPLFSGFVKNIVAEGKAGFIGGDDGSDYYFKMRSFQGSRNLLQIGTRVRFMVEKNPDSSKRDIAIFIEVDSS